jgi:diamine N-acetyltransferase
MLKGKDILLRNLKSSDLSFLSYIENNKENWRFGGDQQYFTRAQLIEYIDKSSIDIADIGQYRFVIEYKKEPIGFIDLFDYSISSASIGIIIDVKHRRKGFATQAIRLLINYAFTELNLNVLYCSVSKDNISSIKLFTSVGFYLLEESDKENRYSFTK